MANEIIATFNVCTTYNLDENGINPKDIQEYFVKYGVLNVLLKNNDDWIEIEAENDLDEFDFKYPHEVDEYFQNEEV